MNARTRTLLGHVTVYGVTGAVLTLALQLVEYRWLVIGHSFQIYGVLVAVLFCGAGLWAGRRLVGVREVPVPVPVEVPVHVPVEVRVMVPIAASPPGVPFERDETWVKQLGLTPRELEILEAIAEGLSNREVAGRLFVSENTVKTHAARVFDKLGVQRRVQAVQKARSLRLIP